MGDTVTMRRSMYSLRRARFVTVILATLSALSACGSTNLHVQNRNALAKAAESVASGDRRAGAQRLEKMLVASNVDEQEYAPQRFAAAYLLTRAHLEAGLAAPFLTESARSGAFVLGGTDERRPSTNAHLVAANYWASYARSWHQSAQGSGAVSSDGERLLPPALDEYGFDSARDYVNVALFAIYSRLNFQDRVAGCLHELQELVRLDECDAFLSRAQVDPATRLWVYHAIFEYLDRAGGVSHEEAFRFASRTLDLLGDGVDRSGSLDAREISEWILHNKRWEWICPSCKNPIVDPLSDTCMVCRQASRIDFEVSARDNQR